ncbi:spore germination protein [Oscillospiraceae bacterium MB08-C2-2]|nr:spore germination protein [Oscillospiraceae bacterium MB08-C2-2]
MRFFDKLFWRLKEQQKQKNKTAETAESKENSLSILSSSLQKNLDTIKAKFDESADLVIREFTFGNTQNGEIKAGLVFLDGLANLPLINNDIIKPLMYDSRIFATEESEDVSHMDQIRNRLMAVGEVKTVYTYDDVINSCLSGNAVFLAEGFRKALDIGAKGWEKRAVTEPTSETAIRGPREGFTENLRTNTSMIRRKIKDPALKVRSAVIGKRTHTQINILYVEGIVDPDLVREVERRLKKIDTDAILAAGYVEQYIEDSPFSVFPTIWCSEKPDAVAGKILEGRVAVVVDGAPFVMTMPMLFIENFQSAEDYIARSYYATIMRLLRMVAFFICLFAPAIYVALSAYHQELIPTTFLFSMAAASESTPFPVAVEMGVMMTIFGILREAGIRLPRPIGQTISIVGALVMGEAAVQAGIVGAPVVIVVAMTAVSSFAVPFISDALTILSWFLLLMSTIMGSFGITVGVFIIIVHLTSLRSFGAPYLAPFAPIQMAGMKDTAVRAPLWTMSIRPQALNPQDSKRRGTQSLYDFTPNKDDRSKKP